MALSQQEPDDVAQRIRQATQIGGLVDLTVDTPEHDHAAQGASWNAARTVRAELLTRPVPPHDLPARPLRLRGARVTSSLDLEAAILVRPLFLQDCFFEEPINLQEAQASAIRLPGCQLPSLVADQLETRGNLELTRGFTARGEVRLMGAHIGGILDCDGGHFTAPNPEGYAINAVGLTVGGAMFCGEEFTAEGEVRLLDARIGAQFSCSGGRFTNPDGCALAAYTPCLHIRRIDGQYFNTYLESFERVWASARHWTDHSATSERGERDEPQEAQD
jgi:hypothetical protein